MAVLAAVITDFCVGDALTLTRTVTEAPTPITSATLVVHALQGALTTPLITKLITPTLSSSGQITNPGTLQPDGSYTALVSFTLLAADTLTLVPGQTAWASIQVSPGPYVSELIPLLPLVGGPNG